MRRERCREFFPGRDLMPKGTLGCRRPGKGDAPVPTGFSITGCRGGRSPILAFVLGICAALGPADAPGQAPPGPARETGAAASATATPARQVPDALNFANGLFRERR